ncbi:hypothetical protein [Marinobacterium litorale]|uniref:hypothetical protein n=1 Tax=Marinobacterium litorale TaxID=404770 RepID=UPI000487AD9C|nr:hypothetical protein [Marinobacterium litorale]
MLNIFIGYDEVESIAWHTMAHSIFTRSSKPVSIIPLSTKNLKGIYKRERDPKQSNDFSFTRFLVPFLSDYKGWAVFFDCDMLIQTDIYNLLNEVDKNPGKAVYVVKHDYTPRCEYKYLGNKQYKYPRKNWSSVILWNCNHPANRKLTPDFINTAPAMNLHRFMWLNDEDIGELDVKWNWLVGEYSSPPNEIMNIHWTIGGPYFNEYRDTDFAKEWFDEKEKMTYCKQKK